RVILVTRNAARKPTTTGAIKRAARRTGGRLSRAAGHQARGTRPRRRARRHRLTSLGRPRLDGLENLLLHGLEVEAGSFLQRRGLDERLAALRHLLRHEGEPPELVDVEAVEVQRAGQAGPLERVEADVREDRPVDLNSPAEPAVRLVDEPV